MAEYMKNHADRLEQLIKRRIEFNHYEQADGRLSDGLQLPEPPLAARADFLRNDWSLAELLAYYDRDFVRNAYLVLLKRDADVAGLNERLLKLQSHQVSRIEMLVRLRYGPEGRQHQTRVRGLLRAFFIERICAIPVLGVIPRYLVAVFRLPRLMREIEDLRGLVAMRRNESLERDRAIADFVNRELGRRTGDAADD